MTPGGQRQPNPPPRRPHPPTVPPRDSKSSLYEAAVAAVRDRATQARARAGLRPRRRRSPVVRVLGFLGLVGLVMLVLRPSWLAGPTGLQAETGAVAAASLRLVLMRERDLVRAYLRRTGRLPATLLDAGSTARGVDYRRAGERFLLSATTGDSLVVLRDSDSTAAFLGTSLTRLKNRARETP
ncbi:MAG: hypothetical protein ACT4PM_04960 [Gemmatimonadales bacterium]